MSPETVLGVISAAVAVLLTVATLLAMSREQTTRRRSPFQTWMP